MLHIKKYIAFIFIFIVALLVNTDVEASNPIQVLVDGKKIQFNDMQPIIEDGRVLVPLRAIQESFGSKIEWDQHSRKITSLKEKANEKTILTYYIDFPYLIQIYQNGQSVEQTVEKIDVSPKLVKSRTMVPLRSATESMGYSVSWSQKTRTVTILSNASVKPLTNDLQYEMVGSGQLSQMEFDVFFLTNRERVQEGLKPFILDLELSSVAQIKSKDMHDHSYFDHHSPTYGSPFEMMAHYDVAYRSAGENIAAGFGSARAVVTGWMNSEGHRKNIMNTGFERIGIGYYYGPNEYKSYYTQLFISK